MSWDSRLPRLQAQWATDNFDSVNFQDMTTLHDSVFSSVPVASVIYLNSMSVTWTARIQIFLTFSKLLAIALIIVPGMYQLFKGKTPSSSPSSSLSSSSHLMVSISTLLQPWPEETVRYLVLRACSSYSGTFSEFMRSAQLQQLRSLPLSHTTTCTVNITLNLAGGDTQLLTASNSSGISQCPHSRCFKKPWITAHPSATGLAWLFSLSSQPWNELELLLHIMYSLT